MVEDKICDNCKKFRRPHWINTRELGICEEGMFGDCEASDKNEGACKYFEEEKK